MWLDALELGSVVPPYGSLSFLLVFPLCRHFGLDQPGLALLPLILSMLAAYTASWCELRQRIELNPMVDAVVNWCGGKGPASPGRVILMAGLCRAMWQTALYAVCFAIIYVVLTWLAAHRTQPALPGVTWSALYVAALLGAVLSLRTRQAYAVLVGTLGALALLIWGGN